MKILQIVCMSQVLLIGCSHSLDWNADAVAVQVLSVGLETRFNDHDLVRASLEVTNASGGEVCLLMERYQDLPYGLSFGGIVDVDDVSLKFQDGSETSLQASSYPNPINEYISKVGRSRHEVAIVLGAGDHWNGETLLRLKYIDGDDGFRLDEIAYLSLSVRAVPCTDDNWPEPPWIQYTSSVIDEYVRFDPALGKRWSSFWSEPYLLDR